MSYSDHYVKQKEAAQMNFDALIEAAQFNGLKVIEIQYAGYGDSGGIDDVFFGPKEATLELSQTMVRRVDVESLLLNEETRERTYIIGAPTSKSLEDAAQGFFYDICDRYDIDFNNGGCNGTMEINVDTREIKVNNTYMIEETEVYTDTM